MPALRFRQAASTPWNASPGTRLPTASRSLRSSRPSYGCTLPFRRAPAGARARRAWSPGSPPPEPRNGRPGRPHRRLARARHAHPRASTSSRPHKRCPVAGSPGGSRFARDRSDRRRFHWRTLDDARLDLADLRGADFSHADLASAAFYGAVADATTIWPADFDPQQAGVLPADTAPPARPQSYSREP
jgi:hypothetical protein